MAGTADSGDSADSGREARSADHLRPEGCSSPGLDDARSTSPSPSPPPPPPPDAVAPAVRPAVPPADPDGAGGPGAPRTGVAALSLRYQIAAALALAVVAATVCVHLGMVFLHVAPSNTVTKAHGEAIDDWIYPEFEQNWKLFAPNPLQQNIAVQVRAQVRTADGATRTTGWYDLSAEDGRAIDGNLLPSHTQQNELRRAWDFYTATHGGGNQATAPRGVLAETYLRRIVVLRLHRAEAAGPGGEIERVQVRSRTTPVRPPKWSDERISPKPVYRELSWWTVPADESRGGAG
ncbi:DUF5819 family protein [Streptomyces sp. NPDC052676]|uniref:DUF5819 family protein n=1 Tax=Streptomyces sp. NPDC052676 TaxID=3154953 RepID=UPI0034333DFB